MKLVPPSSTALPREMDVAPAGRPLRVAVVYSRSPLPMRRADQMTVAHLISFLHARGHEVDLFAPEAGGHVEPEHRSWLETHCRAVRLFPHGRARMLLGAARGLLRGLPLQVGVFSNPALDEAFAAAVETEGYDVVYVYYLRSAEVVREVWSRGAAEGVRRPPTVLAMQLSQALNTRRIKENAPNLWVKALYELESRLVARYEAGVWRSFTRTVLIGRSDLQAITAEAQARGLPAIDNSFFSPHGTDVSRFKPRADVPVEPGTIVFSGVMRTPTNVQAVQWFVRHVWPLVRAERPDARFVVVGREPTREVLRLQDAGDGVVVTGTVDDPAAWIAKAQVCVNPMQAGGGMQNKLIEYLASGKPTVATPVANEGIEAPADALVVAESPEDFARAVLDLLGDEERAAALAHRARQYALAEWTWEHHFLQLERELAALSEEAPQRRRAA